MEFLWYDYETWGRFPKYDRPLQVAFIRTDADLNEIGDPLVLYCSPREDCLISPGAVAVNRMTPQEAQALGVCEAEFAKKIHGELTKSPNTCIVGYNAMTFDHEITRYLLYRNLADPYRWHWGNGNRRLDLIFLVSAVRLLRPDVLSEWPQKSDGRPSFKLEDLARANSIESVKPAHDALADTGNLLNLARIIKRGSPQLFEHWLKMGHKFRVKEESRDTFLYASPFIRDRGRYASILTKIGPVKENIFWSFDLSTDPVPLQKSRSLWSDQDHKQAARSIRRVKTNAAPFVRHCPLPAQTPRAEATLEAMGLSSAKIQANLKQLRTNLEPIDDYCASKEEEWAQSDHETVDADEALYSGGFWSDAQYGEMRKVVAAGGDASQWQRKFDDPRLETLVFRYRARNFPEALTAAEQDRWRGYCRGRHLKTNDEFDPVDRWEKGLRKLKKDPANASLVASLEDWHAQVKASLGID